MRIVFFHEVNYLLKPVYEMHEFPEFLSTRGHHVDFVHFAEGDRRGQMRRAMLSEIAPKKSHAQGHTEVMLHTPFQVGGGLIARGLAFILSPIQVPLIIRRLRPEVVVSYSVATNGLALALTCSFLRIPLVLRVIDVPSRIRSVGPLRKVIRLSEKALARRSTKVSALTPSLRDRFANLTEGDLEKFTVDPPPLNTRHFEVKSNQIVSFRKNAGWEAKTVFVFVGTFFHFAQLDELVRDFGQKSDDTDLLVLYGGGEAQPQIEKALDELPEGARSRIRLGGFLSYEDMPTVLAAADVAINSLRPSTVTNEALPNKVLQYAAAGLPIVSTRLSSLEEVFSEEDLGIYWVDDMSSMTIMCKKVASMDTESLSKVRLYNKAFSKERFNLEVAGSRMERLILSAARKP